VAAIDELASAIAAAKAGDPMAPVTVVVPSNYAGLSVRRLLGGRSGGLVNVQFLTIARVAELLGAPALAAAGRRPLTRAVRSEAIRAALAASGGALAGVATHASTLDALDRTFTDLRLCAPGPLSAIATMSPRAAEVVSLFETTRAALADRYYDEHDLALAAAGDLGQLIVYLPRPLPPSMESMVARLGATVIERDVGNPPPVDRVISAVDPDDEMRAAIRVVMDEARRGVPLHRMAILWPTDEPYAVVAHQQLEAAGIPHNGPATRSLAQTVSGAALVQLLSLADRDFRRDQVIGWLSSAPIIEVGGETDIVHASQWDVVSGAAGVIAGPAQWQDRVARYAASLAERRDALIAEGDADAGRIERIDADIERAARLRAFMSELTTALDAAALHSWSALSEWSVALLERYLGGEDRHYRWPDAEQDAFRAVRDALLQLSALDDVAAGAPVDLTRFRQAVAAELSTPAARHGRFGTGVFTAPVAAALGTDFDVVVIVGLAEGSCPSRRSEDALIPDAERSAAGGAVPLRGARIDDELADFRSALAASRRLRVLTWPRTDPRRRRERLPSRWLPAGVAEERVESFQHGLRGAEPASLPDYDLRSLLEWADAGGAAIDSPLAAELPGFGAGIAAAHFRAGSSFTRFSGAVGAGRIDPVDPDAPLSPTSLETYAECPARYFFSKVLHLGPPERPEEIRRIAPMTKGTLVHDVLETFIKDALADPLSRTIDHLLELVETAFADYEARGLVGVPLLWRYERELMRRELVRFFNEDTEGEPLAAELTFGRAGEQPVVLTLPDGSEIGFRGMADRVDQLPGGALRVTDYKTGGDWKYRQVNLVIDPVARGRLLQLPLYGLAARERFGQPDTPVESRYWMVAEKADFRRHPVVVDDKTLERLRKVLGVLVDGITGGRFPARPGEENWRGGWEHCTFCDFNRVCAADRDQAWERVQSTPELSAYVALVDGLDLDRDLDADADVDADAASSPR
jgi:RecB family exonuclease